MHRCQLFCLIIKEYMSRGIHTSNKALTLFMTDVFVVYKPVHLICCANQYTGFYKIGSSLMKELRRSLPMILQKSVLTCRKAELPFFLLFFLSGYSFTNIHD